jgi:hypothetical protein
MGRCGLDSSGSGYRQVVGSCEYGNESSGSIKGREFLDQLSDYQILTKDYAPCHYRFMYYLCPSYFSLLPLTVLGNSFLNKLLTE